MVISLTKWKQAKIIVDRKNLEQVNNFKYLGHTVNEEGQCEHEQKHGLSTKTVKKARGI